MKGKWRFWLGSISRCFRLQFTFGISWPLCSSLLAKTKICIKYRKHGSSSFCFQTFICVCFSLIFDYSKRVHLKSKIDLSLTFMLDKFLVQTYRNSNFVLVFWFIWVFLVLGIFYFVELFACWQVSEANPKECIYEKTEGDSWEICVS